MIWKEKASAGGNPAGGNTAGGDAPDQFTDATEEAMRTYLASKGVTPRANAAPDSLRMKCREIAAQI